MSIIYRVRERDNVRRVRVHTVGSQLPGGVGSVGGEIYGQKKRRRENTHASAVAATTTTIPSIVGRSRRRVRVKLAPAGRLAAPDPRNSAAAAAVAAAVRPGRRV